MSGVGKPGYKETAVGWIPVEWHLSKLDELVEKVGSGVTPKGGSESYLSSGVPLIRSQNIQWGRLNLQDVAFISEAQHERMSNSSLKPRDVLLNITGASIGRCAVLPNDFKEGNVNQHVCIIRPIESLEPHYLSHFLLSEFGQGQIEKLQAGGNREGLNYQQIRGFFIALPSIPEQQKIAAILTAVDDKLDLIARQISATQTLKQGLMQTLFTRGAGTQDAQGRWHPHTEFQDTELGRIPVGWRVGPIGSVARESRERNAGQLNDRLLSGVSKEHGLVPMRDRVKGASTDRCRVVAPNAFAYNPMRINIGSIARNLQDHSLMVSPDYVVFSTVPELLLAKYLDHLRRSDLWAAYVGRSGDGGVRIRIYFDDLARFRLAIPPLVEQQRIVEMLDSVDDKLTTLTTQKTHYQSLKRGLMQKLLTGQWRVRVDAATLAPVNEKALA